MRLELIASTLAFGAGSLYWIIAALMMDAAQYGALMLFQSVLLLCVGMFSFRTYDLTFFLQKHFNMDVRGSFFFALGVEVALSVVCTLSICLIFSLGVDAVFGMNFNLALSGVALAAVLCSATIYQGASQAFLRTLNLDKQLVLADALSGVGFLVASWLLIVNNSPTSEFVLASWLIALAVRPSVIVALALVYVKNTAPAILRGDSVASRRGEIAKFLLAGQLTNLLKNNAVAIETLVLGRLGSAEAVALYRVARSLLNFPSVLLNVAYQKSFRELISAKTTDARNETFRRINRQGLRIWGLALPITIAAAAVFTMLNSDAAYSQLLLVLVMLAVATFPSVLQQATFASLMLDGRFGPIGLGYLAGILVLVVGSVACLPFFSIEIFAAWLFAASLIRYQVLRALSKY